MAGVADPLRKISRGDRVENHIQTIRRFLYEEGPNRAIEISLFMKLSEYRVRELLCIAHKEGSIEQFRRGTQVYWMFPENEDVV